MEVVGKGWHMDFFASTEILIFVNFDKKIFLFSKISFSCELVLVYPLLNHIKLIFNPSNLMS